MYAYISYNTQSVKVLNRGPFDCLLTYQPTSRQTNKFNHIFYINITVYGAIFMSVRPWADSKKKLLRKMKNKK